MRTCEQKAKQTKLDPHTKAEGENHVLNLWALRWLTGRHSQGTRTSARLKASSSKVQASTSSAAISQSSGATSPADDDEDEEDDEEEKESDGMGEDDDRQSVPPVTGAEDAAGLIAEGRTDLDSDGDKRTDVESGKSDEMLDRSGCEWLFLSGLIEC